MDPCDMPNLGDAELYLLRAKVIAQHRFGSAENPRRTSELHASPLKYLLIIS